MYIVKIYNQNLQLHSIIHDYRDQITKSFIALTLMQKLPLI